MTRQGRIKDCCFINWEIFISFFYNYNIKLLSKSNGKKEVIEKIKKWLVDESFQFKEVKSGYTKYQADLQM